MFNICRWVLALGFIVLGAAVVAADKAPERPKPQPKPQPEAPEEVKLPWGVEEVKEDWKHGRVFSFAVSIGGKAGQATMTADPVTKNGFTLTAVMHIEGAEHKDKPEKKTFEEHISTLKTQVTGAETEEVDIEVKAGKYTCTCYSLVIATRAATRTQKYWLSSAVPGMFVKAERTELRHDDTKRVDSWELASVDLPRVSLPWSLAQVQEAWKGGLALKYGIVSETGESGWASMAISEVNAEGFTITRTLAIEGRDPRTDEPRVTRWESWLRELAPPSHNAALSDEVLETKAGSFECLVVTTSEKREGGTSTQRVWYSKKDPGVVVKMSIEGEHNGTKDVEIWTLVELKRGK